jgi:two-component system sensor histidine kinase ChvG
MAQSDISQKKPSAWHRFMRFRGSHLAQRIITFNTVALCVLMVGILYLSQFQNNSVRDRRTGMVLESDLFVRLAGATIVTETDPVVKFLKLLDTVSMLPVSNGLEVRFYAPDGVMLAAKSTVPEGLMPASKGFTDKAIAGFKQFFAYFSSLAEQPYEEQGAANAREIADELALDVLNGSSEFRQRYTADGYAVLAIGRPLIVNDVTEGVMVLSTVEGYLEQIVGQDRNAVLRVFMLALAVSVVLSIVLAKTIANPIHDLAEAAEAGKQARYRDLEPDKVKIPNLMSRPDEIGRLSVAMREMTSALYDRIEANERFAADVAHEIKNPLASLRSAVETLRATKSDQSREKMMKIIEHDIRRMDRLVSDISHMSRLDGELVKEQMKLFDITRMLENIVDFHRNQSDALGVELLWDRPASPIYFNGIEERLAQVIVNLLSNAISFCEENDVVRLWIRERDDRILIAVEDTGPGIPEDSLETIFSRFYSQRPTGEFGGHSGLGLAISKQIVEAHNGVIWAENIRGSGPEAEIQGARFIIGLPT